MCLEENEIEEMNVSLTEAKELAPYTERASRLELVIRWFYGIVIGVVYWLWGIWIAICMFLHFWYILFLGRRSPTLYRHTRRYVNATVYVASYLMYLTDSRPTLTPNIILYWKEAEAVAPKPPIQPPTTKFCVHCGAEMAAEAVFCPKCGGRQ